MPFQFRNILFFGFKSCSRRKDKTPRESLKSSNRCTDTSVNKEYKDAFRSDSYMEIHDRVQRQLVRTGSSRPSLSLHFLMNLLEPQPEIINSMMESRNLHPMLVNFFDAGLSACRECEQLLLSVYKTRAYYGKIQKAIEIARGMNSGRKTDELSLLIHKELVEFAKLENPLQAICATRFDGIRNHYTTLFRRLTSKLKKEKRRRRFLRLFEKLGKWGLVVSCTAISVAPKSKRTNPRGILSAQLDQAAKGIFVLISYLDTMNSLLRRLHNEVDRIKTAVNICAGNMSSEHLKLLAKELEARDSNFMERAQELEEHICLCFLDINRARRSIMQVTMDI